MKSARVQLESAAVVALGLFTLAGQASAACGGDDPVTAEPRHAATTQIESISRRKARLANEAAVRQATRAIKADNKLDLDIRLVHHHSVVIAGEN